MTIKFRCPKCDRKYIDWGAEKLGYLCPDCKEELSEIGMEEADSKTPSLKSGKAKAKAKTKPKAKTKAKAKAAPAEKSEDISIDLDDTNGDSGGADDDAVVESGD